MGDVIFTDQWVPRPLVNVDGITENGLKFPLGKRRILPNDQCTCGSGVKYKKCCRKEVSVAGALISG